MKTKASAFSVFKARSLKEASKKTPTKRRRNKPRKATPFRPVIGPEDGHARLVTPRRLPRPEPSRTSANETTVPFGRLEQSTDTDSSLTSCQKKKSRKRKVVNSPSMEVSLRTSHALEGLPFAPYMLDSRLEAEACLEWMIHPYKRERFFRDVWERKPLLLQRHNNRYYRELFSMATFDRILREKCLWFDKNIDVTTYVDGRRETHNPGGRAHASVVWDYFDNGCSVRLLNPQTFSRLIWKLTATLHDVFGSFVGANVYLTPPGSQGFAPHFDDIEAFVLQLEGKKMWRLYRPRNENEVLPRFSSRNLTDEEIGNPVLEVELEAGDMLYFPRGTIHQASTPPDSHSLHITVSTCQRNAWGDLLELVVPRALEIAMETDLEFRRGLPSNYSRHAGIANSDIESSERTQFTCKVKELMKKLIDHMPLDDAVDQLAKRSIHDALPPLLTKEEKRRTIYGEGNGRSQIVELEPDTGVKLIRSQLIRLVMEEDGIKIYHSADNSREYHKEEIQFVEINAPLAPAVEYLIQSYPNFVSVESLPLSTLEEKMAISTLLYERGLLMTDEVIRPQ